MTTKEKPIKEMTDAEFAAYFFGMPITEILFINQINGTDKTQVVAKVDYAVSVDISEFIINADTFELHGQLQLRKEFHDNPSYIDKARKLFGNDEISWLSSLAMNEVYPYEKILSDFNGGTNLVELIGQYVPKRVCAGKDAYIKTAELIYDNYVLKLGFYNEDDNRTYYVNYVNEVPTFAQDVYPIELFEVARNLFGSENAYDVVVNNKHGSIKSIYQFKDGKIPSGYQQYNGLDYYVRFPINNPKLTIDKDDEKKLFTKAKAKK